MSSFDDDVTIVPNNNNVDLFDIIKAANMLCAEFVLEDRKICLTGAVSNLSFSHEKGNEVCVHTPFMRCAALVRFSPNLIAGTDIQVYIRTIYISAAENAGVLIAEIAEQALAFIGMEGKVKHLRNDQCHTNAKIPVDVCNITNNGEDIEVFAGGRNITEYLPMSMYLACNKIGLYTDLDDEIFIDNFNKLKKLNNAVADLQLKTISNIEELEGYILKDKDAKAIQIGTSFYMPFYSGISFAGGPNIVLIEKGSSGEKVAAFVHEHWGLIQVRSLMNSQKVYSDVRDIYEYVKDLYSGNISLLARKERG